MEAKNFANQAVDKLRNFYPKSLKNLVSTRLPAVPNRGVNIDFQAGRFQVKLANNEKERKSAFNLRRKIFENEYQSGGSRLEISTDLFDEFADLLIVKNLADNSVVGTYRIICSDYSERFGNDVQFNLDNFLKTEGTKVEICLACIHPNFRQGSVVSLLWRGIYEYLTQVNAKYLFGGISFPFIGPTEIFAIIMYFKNKKYLDNRYDIVPFEPYDHSLKILNAINDPKLESVLVKPLMSPLCRAYLNAGATLATVPAFDPQFRCYDFLSILDLKDLKASHNRRFGKRS